MSKIGKEPIQIEAGVEINVSPENIVKIKGKGGELQERIPKEISVEQKEQQIVVTKKDDSKEAQKYWGLSRTLIANMVLGVTNGYEKKLEIIGVGYRAEKKGKKLVLNLGYSHPVEMEDPEGLTTETPDQNTIVVKGISKERVGNYAAIIRSKRPPEPYKGKGIRLAGEYVRKKEGKAGVKGE